jgi:hypothetical protein
MPEKHICEICEKDEVPLKEVYRMDTIYLHVSHDPPKYTWDEAVKSDS